MWSPPNPAQFNALVYMIVRQIPEGSVSSYGQIASMIPPPVGVPPPSYSRLGARWVGTAMRQCPDDVPWQRVINSQGRISLPAGSLEAETQYQLLLGEGVRFKDNGRLDWRQYGWNGPDSTWLEEHHLCAPRLLG